MLHFEYRPGAFIDSGYHITEVKNIVIEAVNCGGKMDTWKETVVQLWEDTDATATKENLSCYKALGILNKVNRMSPLQGDTEILFEYGNASFHTAQLKVLSINQDSDAITLSLSGTQTDCKAREACMIPVADTVSECCTPESGCC